MAANFFQPGFDEQTENQNIERQRKYAELLRQQSEQSPQGSMVSGYYVAPSITQGLAQMLKAYQGGKGMREADARQKALAEAVRGRQTEELGKFTGLMNGRPAEQLPADQFGPARPAEKPDLAAAYQYAAGAKTPGLQQVGLTGAMQMAQERAKQEQAAAQQQRVLGIIQSAGSPQAAIAAGAPPDMVRQFYEARNYGRDEVTFQDVGGEKVPVTKFGDRPEGIASLQKTGNPFSDLVVRDPTSGNIVPNAPLASTKAGIAAAGKPVISVDARNYNTQESEQSKVYGKALGESRAAITQSGIEAPKRLAQIDRMEELLKGVDGGRFAPAGAELASAAESLGIKIDPKLGNKQAAEALAVQMALSIRPPSSGPMTDKDFDNFLKTVPGLAKTPEGRTQIGKTMRAAIQRDLEAAKFARDYAKQNGGTIDDNFFEALADFYGKNPVVTPQMPATNARGNKVFDAADAIINGGKKR